MSIVIYLALWVAIGLLAGVIANWISETGVWPWFWVDLFCGLSGAIISGYFVTKALFGISVVLSAFSLILAGAGAVLLLLLARVLRRIMS